MNRIYAEKEAYGITERSTEFVEEHLPQLGLIVRIEGFLAGNKADELGTEQWVAFEDKEHNRIVVSGFSWGYAGEGPHGLLRMANKLGFGLLVIDDIARLGQSGGFVFQK